MSQFEQELPQLSNVDQLKQIMQTHKDNIKDLQFTMKMFSMTQEAVFSTYFTTLESDMDIIRVIIKRIEDDSKN